MYHKANLSGLTDVIHVQLRMSLTQFETNLKSMCYELKIHTVSFL